MQGEDTGLNDEQGAPISYGDQVRFVYNGSQDQFAGQEFIGTVVPNPWVTYEHGVVPLEGGYALDVEKLDGE